MESCEESLVFVSGVVRGDAISEVLSPDRLAVQVADANATYPVRIDPTFSDEDWISMVGLPGANGIVHAPVVDASGNLYIGREFTVVGNVLANRVAKWDGSSWSALGSGLHGTNPYTSFVRALAVLGSDLYAGGWFTTAGGEVSGCITERISSPSAV
jgi:hypothetical protein